MGASRRRRRAPGPLGGDGRLGDPAYYRRPPIVVLGLAHEAHALGGPPGSFSNMGKCPRRAKGLHLFSSPMVEGTVHEWHDSAHFNLRWISSLSGSANKSANLQFLHVYSWPTQTFVSSGKARNF